jgi:hypothetical protein
LSQRWNNPTLLGCAVVQGGGMFGSAPGLQGSPALPYLAAGARAAFDIDIISDRLSARLASDFLGVLSRPALGVEGRAGFETRPFSMAIGGGLGVFF